MVHFYTPLTMDDLEYLQKKKAIYCAEVKFLRLLRRRINYKLFDDMIGLFSNLEGLLIEGFETDEALRESIPDQFHHLFCNLQKFEAEKMRFSDGKRKICEVYNIF